MGSKWPQNTIGTVLLAPPPRHARVVTINRNTQRDRGTAAAPFAARLRKNSNRLSAAVDVCSPNGNDAGVRAAIGTRAW